MRRGILPYICQGMDIYHTLIAAPPGVGKTTYLRDLIRLLSGEEAAGRNITVVDERYEIAAGVHGVPQNDLGMRTDVISGCRKEEAMLLALRTMKPDIIAVDELGGERDDLAVDRIVTCGVRLLATAHAGSMEQLWQQRRHRVWMERQIFQRYVFLKKISDGSRRFFHIQRRGRECAEAAWRAGTSGRGGRTRLFADRGAAGAAERADGDALLPDQDENSRWCMWG